MWRFVPFYLALIAAPLLFGGVKPESQAILGILFSIALMSTIRFRPHASVAPLWVKAVLVGFLILPLVPLPLGLVSLLSPERARLAAEFPIEGEVQQWLTLSTSPARTIQRLWEIALALAAFVGARRHGGLPNAKRNLGLTLSIALICLAAADIWSAQHSRDSVLGIWKISWGKGYGTFANHNHFANWIFVASLFCAGWMIRELCRRDRSPNKPAIVFVGAAATLALVMAFLSASRSGTIAFVLALATFAFLLRRQFTSRSFAMAASAILMAAVIVALLSGEPVLKRMKSGSTGRTMALKSEIWFQTLSIATRFPLFGAGPGSFVRVFNHYKTAHGDGTFLHAENDFLEFALELGFPFAVFAFGLCAFFCAKRLNVEPPSGAGAVAALVMFAVHSALEFNSYVPANLILAFTIAGALIGFSNVESRALKPASFGLSRVVALSLIAIAFLFLSLRQLAGWYAADKALTAPTTVARAKGMNTSIDIFWPYNIDRYITQIRFASENLDELRRQYPTVQPDPYWASEQQRALRLDPLNWELRFAQAQFQLAYSTNTALAISNAWLTIRLNPLQGQIPLRFARRFAKSDPDLALQFLAAVDPAITSNHREALDLAWSMNHDAEQLWKLTPNTTNSILNLIHFAQEKQLYGISAQACQTLEGRIAAEQLARLYLEAHRPGDTLRLLHGQTDLTAQSLRVRALAAVGRHAEAIAEAKVLFTNPTLQSLFERKLAPTASFDELQANHKAHSSDPAAAVVLAEKCAVMSPPNSEILSNLAMQFPTEPRIAFLLFQTQTNNLPAASVTAASLVTRLIP